MTVSVVLVDDQDLMRAGLRLILEGSPDIEVVGEAHEGAEAIAIARELEPDVVLMDIRMPGVDGVEATRRIVELGLRSRVLILTTYDLDEHLYETIRAGACGFLLKTAPSHQLLETIRAAAAGETVLAPSITRRLLERFVRTAAPHAAARRLEDLTSREREVLELIARGLSNEEIATALFVSEATVKSHVNTLFRKLEVRDRVQAVILAYECGLARPGEAHLRGDAPLD